jgi:hypothetical protein
VWEIIQEIFLDQQTIHGYTINIRLTLLEFLQSFSNEFGLSLSKNDDLNKIMPFLFHIYRNPENVISNSINY